MTDSLAFDEKTKTWFFRWLIIAALTGSKNPRD